MKPTVTNQKTSTASVYWPAFALALVAALTMVACYHVEPDTRAVKPVHGLQGFTDCAGFEKYAKNAATQAMMAEIEQLKDSMNGFGGNGWAEDEAIGASDSDGDGDADGDSGGQSDGDDYSETNVQEEGVDEPDLIKNDGNYLYLLHAGELVIADASATGDLDHAGRAQVGGYAEEMFLSGDLAVVFSTLTADQVPDELELPSGPDSSDGWDCDGWDCGYDPADYTQIAVIDVSDRTQPEVLRTIILGGRYNTARLIDNRLKLVIHTDIPILHMSWNDQDFWDEDIWGDDTATTIYLTKLVQTNADRFYDATLADIMPRKLDSMDDTSTALVECDDILGPETPAGIGLTTVVSLDLDTPEAPLSSTAVFGEAGLVYATTDSLYLTTSREYVLSAWSFGLWSEESSGVHKLDISRDDSAAIHLASGTVNGRMLNQFCLGEHEGYLRVATTTGEAWSEDSELDNHVFVLDQKNSTLQVVGRIDGLGKGEEIYAARFLGDRGYVVTFFQTDPLFTLDLSDPTDPKLVGEWLGPGYSTYLHPVNEDQLVAVGMEDWEVTVSLYDVSDFADPTLVERLYFPNGSEYSAAVDDHKAFTYNSETGLLVLPYTGWDGNTGLYLYDVATDGIDHSGTLAVADVGGSVGHVVRSAYIGEAIFGISRCRVVSAALDFPSEVIDSVDLYTTSSCDDYGFGGDDWWGW
jgi:uncharacterized secreted protein with C-terminal beta-propeller domain